MCFSSHSHTPIALTTWRRKHHIYFLFLLKTRQSLRLLCVCCAGMFKGKNTQMQFIQSSGTEATAAAVVGVVVVIYSPHHCLLCRLLPRPSNHGPLVGALKGLRFGKVGKNRKSFFYVFWAYRHPCGERRRDLRCVVRAGDEKSLLRSVLCTSSFFASLPHCSTSRPLSSITYTSKLLHLPSVSSLLPSLLFVRFLSSIHYTHFFVIISFFLPLSLFPFFCIIVHFCFIFSSSFVPWSVSPSSAFFWFYSFHFSLVSMILFSIYSIPCWFVIVCFSFFFFFPVPVLARLYPL